MPVGSQVSFWQNGLAMQVPAPAKPPAGPDRPLSPHLSVYRRQYTMVLSIMHRGSGLFLSACGAVLLLWLVAVAWGAPYYDSLSRLFGSVPGRIFLSLVILAFWYHLFAGLRHMSWDAGFGFERPAARRSGRLILVLAGAAAALTFAAVWRQFVGPS